MGRICPRCTIIEFQLENIIIKYELCSLECRRGYGGRRIFRGKRGFWSYQEGLLRNENQDSKSGARRDQCSTLRNQSWSLGHELWSLSPL